MKQINTALLSYGISGKVFHAPFIHLHPGFRLCGAWERSRQQIGLDYAGTKSYASLEAVVADPDIDLVVVNTPTYTHYEYALSALKAGKHVLVEKAFTTTVAEAETLKSLADRMGVVLSVFQNRRWDSDFSTVRQVVERRMLGTLHTAEFSFLRYRPGIGPKAHVEQPGPGAGLLNDLGPHLIDQALSLFGMPQAVFAGLRTLRPASQVDDCFDIQLTYEGLHVRLYSNTVVLEPQPAYILHGSTGSFIKGRTDRQEELLKSGSVPDFESWYTEPEIDYGLLRTVVDGADRTEKLLSSQGSYVAYYDALHQAITTGSEAPVTASDGVRVMQIIEAVRLSNDKKAVVAIGAD